MIAKGRLLVLLLAVVALPASGGEDASMVAAAQAQSAAADEGYLVGPEDVLEISVWKEDALKKEVLVRPDGGLSFPLVGEVQAEGKTASLIKQEITSRLEKYMPDPVVSVSVAKVASYKIYVIGRVNKPGEFPAGRYVDVLQALSMAGGLTPYASENRIKVLRKENGKEVAIPFQYSRVEKGEKLEQNILLKSGDVVLVP